VKVSDLLKLLKDDNESVRIATIWILQELAPTGKDVVAAYLESLKDTSDKIFCVIGR
jgi:HEAT repeat protein